MAVIYRHGADGSDVGFTCIAQVDDVKIVWRMLHAMLYSTWHRQHFSQHLPEAVELMERAFVLDIGHVITHYGAAREILAAEAQGVVTLSEQLRARLLQLA